jgi:hypothetical protein
VNDGMQNPTELLIWALIVHLIADWLLQNEWMAIHKVKLLHPAAWVHGGIHTLFMLLIFPWHLSILIGFVHVLIDSRIPVLWWMKTVKQIPDPANSEVLVIGMDQVFHVVVLALIIVIFY